MKFELDPYPFSRGGSVVIVVIALMHVYQAGLLHWWPSAIHATNLTAVSMAFRFLHLANGIVCLQIIMYTAAALAVIGAFFRLGWIRVAIFIPQHLILGAMAWGGLLAAYQGHYLDGTQVSWAHITADQAGYVALFLMHSSAIIRRCQDPNG